MADTTQIPNAPQVQQMLPPEFADQIAQLQRKAQIAQALQTQAMAPQPTEMVSGIAVRNSPISALLRALTGTMASDQVNSAMTDSRKVMGDYGNAQRADMVKMLSEPDMNGRIKYGSASQYPMVQQMASKMMEHQNTLMGKGVEAMSHNGDTTGAVRAAATGAFVPNYTEPTQPDPVFNSFTDAAGRTTPTVVNTKNGVKTGSFSQGTTNTNNINMPGHAADLSFGEVKSQLEKRSPIADMAKENLMSIHMAMQALGAGAQTGAGGEISQLARKAAMFLNLNPDNYSSTESLNMALGQSVLANAKKLAPVTGPDIAIVKEIEGGLGTDPNALGRALSWSAARNTKALTDYHDYIDSAVKSSDLVKDPAMKDLLGVLLGGSKIGKELPPQLPGSPVFQLSVIQNMLKNGSDPASFSHPEIAKLNTPEKLSEFLGANFDFSGSYPAMRKKDGSGSGTVAPAGEPTVTLPSGRTMKLSEALALPEGQAILQKLQGK